MYALVLLGGVIFLFPGISSQSAGLINIYENRIKDAKCPK